MATTNRKGKSFFDIAPREIRDAIYNATGEQEIQQGHFTFQFRAPQLQLRLISRQFKNEYDERTSAPGRLVVTSDPVLLGLDEDAITGYTTFPRLATRCISLQVNHLAYAHLDSCDPAADWAVDLGLFFEECELLAKQVGQAGDVEIHLVWGSIASMKYFIAICHQREDPYLEVVLSMFGQFEYWRVDFWPGLLCKPSQSAGDHFKLQYCRKSGFEPDIRRSAVSGAGILCEPAVLGTWNNQQNCFLLDHRGIETRREMEFAMEAEATCVPWIAETLARYWSAVED